MTLAQELEQRERARYAARKALAKYLRTTGRTMTPDERRAWLRNFLRKGR